MGATSGFKLTHFSPIVPSGPPENIRNLLGSDVFGVSKGNVEKK